ncbi:MAG: aminotransferase class V-fold PLP-dependent enzyme [Ignavibacteriales bacterium]|nr:aminotransferase class V-fold PLP-dependent enzyme [Ignavibacteriales bacterium]
MKPIRDERRPLPGNYPRSVNIPVAMKLISRLLSTGFSDKSIQEEFKSEIIERTRRQYVVPLSNCTSAGHAALFALGIGPGDEVICPAISDYATLFAIIALGGTPVFCDVDPNNGNIDPIILSRKITSRTKAIVAVHFWGITCEIDRILAIAKKQHIHVVEDCCQAPFASYKEKLTGSFGDISLFSFSSEKHWAGETGAVALTDSKKLANAISLMGILRGGKYIRNFGRSHYLLGYNYRCSKLDMALALAQLKNLSSVMSRRLKIVQHLDEGLRDIPQLYLPKSPNGGQNVAWMYHFRLSPKVFCNPIQIVRTIKYLGLSDLEMARYYYLPKSCAKILGLQSAVSRFVCPTAYSYCQNAYKWTISENYTDDDIRDIIQIIKTAIIYYLHAKTR